MKMASAPPPPDPYATARAQGDANTSTAVSNTIMGNANEYGPSGYVRNDITGWTTVDGRNIPQYTRTTSLNPVEQHLYNQQNYLGTRLNDVSAEQIDRLQNTLDQPLSLSGLPSLRDSLTTPTFDKMLGGPDLKTFDGAGADLQFYGGRGPDLQNYDGRGPGLQLDDIRGPNYDRLGAGPAYRTDLALGRVGTTFDDAGPVARTFGQANPIQLDVGPNDFSADAQRVRDLMGQRINPGLQRDRAALETQLVNQGLVRGTDAFNQAMDEASRRENDARIAIDLAGGQEQSRLLADALAQGQFRNTAQGQEFDQAYTRGQFDRTGQQQDFDQKQARALFGLTSTGQNNQAALAEAGFNNQWLGQGYQDQATQRGFNNDLEDRLLSYTRSQLAYNNDVRGQNFAADMGIRSYNNDLANQRYEAELQRLGFNNEVGGQRVAADMARTAFNNDVLSQRSAADAARVAGNNELAQQAFGNDQVAAQWQALIRERGLQEDAFMRSSPINDIGALMSGSQVNMPQFAPFRAAQADPAPVAQSVYNSAQLAQDAWRTRTQAQASVMGSLFGLGGSLASLGGRAMGISDRRLKTDIRPLGIKTAKGFDLHEYRFRGDPTGEQHIGVMADEVEPVLPGAVITGANGFKAVDYLQVL